MNTVHSCKNHKTTDITQLDKYSKLVQGQTKLKRQQNTHTHTRTRTRTHTHTHTHTHLSGVKDAVLDGWALTRWHVGHHAMLSGSCQATNHIKPHLPAHRPQPMGCFCLPVYLETNQLQRHNAKYRRPLHIAWPALNALSDAMIIKTVIMRLMYYVRLFTVLYKQVFLRHVTVGFTVIL